MAQLIPSNLCATRGLLVICVFLFSGNAVAQPDANSLLPHVDKRVELLSVVYRLAGVQEFVEAPASAYSKSVDQYFSRYASHPLIVYVRDLNDKLHRDGIDVGAWEVLSLAAHLNAELEPLVSYDDTSTVDGWESRDLFKPELIALLKQFCKDAACDVFFRSQQQYFEEVDRALAKRAIAIDKEWLERFFSLRTTENYSAVLSLLGVGDFAYLRVNFHHNNRDTYTVYACTSFDENGMPTNIDQQKTARSNLHEYIHAYTNQLVDRHLSEVHKSAETLLANPVVWERVKTTFFNNAPFLLYESLVRASSIKYMAAHSSFATTREMEIANQEKAGFLWMRGLVERLDFYENNRRRYRNLEDFMPELIKFFAGVAEAGRNGDQVPQR